MNYRNIFKSVGAIFLVSCALSMFAMNHISPEEQMLFEMCAKNDIAGVSRLIESGLNVNERDDYGRNLLQIACEMGYLDMAKYLVEHGANIFATNMYAKGQNTSLLARDVAFKHKHMDIVKYLDDEYTLMLIKSARGGKLARPNAQEQTEAQQVQQQAFFGRLLPDRKGPILLEMCLDGDAISGVARLIETGANVNVKDENHSTPLYIACVAGDKDLVVCLIEHNANVHSVDRNKSSAREVALRNGYADIVQYLDGVVGGTKGKAASKQTMQTPQVAQAKNKQQQNQGQKNQAQQVSEPFFARMSPKQKNQTLLDMCVEGDDITTIAALIESGADVNTVGDNGRNGLHIACSMGNRDLMQCLLEHGADVYAKDGTNSTARDIALRRGYADIVKYLDTIIALSEKARQASQGGKAKNKQQQNQGQKNKAQQKQQPVPVAQKVVPAQTPKNQQNKNQQNDIKVVRTKNTIRIHMPRNDQDNYFEIVLFKNCQNCPAAGSYFRNTHGIIEVPATLRSDTGLPMVKNHLSNLTYAADTKRKMHMKGDIRHSFPVEVEELAGSWARVMIKNPTNDPDQIVDGAKKFKMFATIPGQINEIDALTGQSKTHEGVFEFTINKRLYDQEDAVCVHRFFAPKGMVGAYEFGAKAQNKRENQ